VNVIDLALALDLGLAQHQDKGGDPDDPKALVLTLIAPTTRGMGIRPIILERREDGSRVLGITARQATRWRKKISPAVLAAYKERMRANADAATSREQQP
jgi:hypothetical protein